MEENAMPVVLELFDHGLRNRMVEAATIGMSEND